MRKQNVLRTFALTMGLTMLVGTAGVSATPAQAAQPAGIVKASPLSDPYAKKVFDLINAERAKVGAPRLIWNQAISNVSQDWAQKLEVATKSPQWDPNTIHRTDAGGSLIPKGATSYSEIIGFNFSPENIVTWWINSPGHKAAMLNPKSTDIGVGYVAQTSGPYRGLNLVVSNLATYPSNTVRPPVQPTSPPVATVAENRLNVVDGSGNLWGYRAPGDSTLIARDQLGHGWGSVKQLMTADWNNDGKLDLIAKWGSGELTMYAGLGNGKYAAPVAIGKGWQDLDITVSKLRKGDTHPGIIARGITDGKLYYYPNNNGSMNVPRLTIGNGGWQVMSELNALDWDKDGSMDVLARNTAGELKLYRGNGATGFVNEDRKTVGNGWQGMKSITAQPDLFGSGTTGLIAKDSSGMLYYYPVSKNAFGAKKVIGSSGWAEYLITEGSPTS